MSESAIDELLDGAPCGFVSFGDNGLITLVNRTLSERLGYAPGELAGKHVEQVLTVAGRLFFQTHFFPLVRMDGRAREVFLLLRSRDGSDVGALCNAERRQRNGVYGTDCVLMEVHERRKYEDALLLAKRAAEDANVRLEEQAVELEVQHAELQEQATEMELQAESLAALNEELVHRSEELERQRIVAEQAQHAADEANHAKSEFLAVMSHELRTPLNAIGGYAQLLDEGIYGPVSEQQRAALGRVTRSQRHLLGLINDVLNLARVETGRVEFSMEDVDLCDVVAELAVMIEPQVENRGLTYRVTLPPEPLLVRADKEKLVQVLLNLLSNAVKFTEAGGSVALTAKPGKRDDRVCIDVTDTGRGIPADKIEAIFEPFVQVRGGRSDATEGTGLGLAISRNLAEGMGGSLTATSELRKGSTFSLELARS